jgi:hypothetical protein
MRLSVTRVLIDGVGALAGYYTLATGQVDFGDLPAELPGHPYRLFLSANRLEAIMQEP